MEGDLNAKMVEYAVAIAAIQEMCAELLVRVNA
jgi:hypothetical protein